MGTNGVTNVSHDLANLQLNEESQKHYSPYDMEPPPPPKLTSKGVIAIDITEQFVNAAKQLDIGQLVKDYSLTLYDAVGALEIMDPKMDSGYLQPGETMEDDYDFTRILLPEEILGIIDQLLCHEMAWHMGHPLSQTIFTSLYIDRILSPTPTSLTQTYFDKSESCSDEEPLCHQILRAYCLGLIKTCSFVNNRVKSEHFYEEEDFVTHTFNRSLLDDFNYAEILKLIYETAKLVGSSPSTLSLELQQALIQRLEFRAKFLLAVEAADSRTSQDAARYWNELLATVPGLQSSAGLGKSVESAFSVKIQRKLASTVPPRPIVEVGRETACNHLERICRDAAVAVEIFQYYDSHSLKTFVWLFQSRKPQPSVYVRTLLQHYIFSDMVILGHSSIRRILDDDLCTTVLPASILLDHLNDEIEVPTDPRHLMSTKMEVFRCRAAMSYLDILRTICQNRCRIRRTLCHNIADWDNLQLDAEELDLELQILTKEKPIPDTGNQPIFSFPLSSWAYFYKLRQMEWIIQMGFELQIYQPDELAGMYWYLQYIVKTRIQHLDRIHGFLLHSFTTTTNKKTVISPQQVKEYADARNFINFSTLEARTTSQLADALSALYVVLTRLNLIPPLCSPANTPRPYSTDQLRYSVRMKPFTTIGLPELIPFDSYTQLVNQPEVDVEDLLAFAKECVGNAKKGLEKMGKMNETEAWCRGVGEGWKMGIRDVMRACILTGVGIEGVRRAYENAKKVETEVKAKAAAKAKGKGRGKEKEKESVKEGLDVKLKVEIPEKGKGYHDWWTVPKVMPIP